MAVELLKNSETIWFFWSEIFKNIKLYRESYHCATDPNSGFLFYLIDKHMWLFAIWLIPISLCYDIYWWFQVRWNYLMCKSNANRLHEEKVNL